MTRSRDSSAPPADTLTIPSVSPAVTRSEAADGANDRSADAVEESRSDRAREEAMTVRPLRDRRYVVETEGGTYVVALDAGTCTCPDHAIRGSRCKHLRRVAMEVTEGAVPAPDERVGVCAVCGAETFVPFAEPGPHLCGDHAFAVGDAVRDRETGKLLVVTRVTDERADEYRTDEGRTIESYATNADYGAHEPVVEAVYAESLGPARGLDDARSYGFPASRLRSVAGGDDGSDADDASDADR